MPALLSLLLVLGVVTAVGSPAGAAAPQLAPATTTSTDDMPVQFAVGDFDDDGDLDAAVANLWRSVGVLLNDGTGAFTYTRYGPYTTLLFVPSGTPSITGLDVGDFDNDGHLDLVFATYSGEYLGFLFGAGDGTFSPLVAVNIVPGGQSFPDEVAVGDVNNDGNSDVVFTRSLTSRLEVLIGTGSRSFTRTSPVALPHSGPNGLELGDLDGDGDLDASVVYGAAAAPGDPSGRMSVLANDGVGSFMVTASHSVVGTNGNNPSPHDNPLAIGDVDGDGDNDVLVPGNHSTTLNMLTNDGAGNLAVSGLDVGTAPWGVAIADFNGDGTVDIALGGRGSGRVHVLEGAGGGAFGTPQGFSAGGSVMGVASGDFDGDQRPDVLAALAFSDQVALLRNAMAPPNTAPTPSTGGPYTGTEGEAVAITGTAPDPDGDTVTTGWTASGASVDAGASCTFGDSAALATTVTCTDDGSWTLTLSATDGKHAVVLATTQLTVANSLPTATVSSPASGALHAVGDGVSVTIGIGDTGSNDTHTCTVDWDDGSPVTAGTITGAPGARSCTATHLLTSAGVNTISATVSDDDGASTVATVMIVVYDPSAGFVTGGGWIDSPPGAYTLDPSIVGRASFGFVSKYHKGATTPTGQTEFQFRAATLSFASTSYDWLVVSGSRAQYKGSGTLNGVPGYTFLLTATDGGASGGGGVDKLRMKIRDGAGVVIYDNAAGASDDIDAASPQAIGGGSIVIHK